MKKERLETTGSYKCVAGCALSIMSEDPMNWLRPFKHMAWRSTVLVHFCMMSGAPMKCQWSLRRMNTVGDGYWGEGCPYDVPGSGSWDALPSRARDMGKGFSHRLQIAHGNGSGERDLSHGAHRVHAVQK
eukprot:1533313-Heterocapsa_arctica.AAC.1